MADGRCPGPKSTILRAGCSRYGPGCGPNSNANAPAGNYRNGHASIAALTVRYGNDDIDTDGHQYGNALGYADTDANSDTDTNVNLHARTFGNPGRYGHSRAVRNAGGDRDTGNDVNGRRH